MKARDTSGAATVEFAIVGLVFVSFLLLAMETAWQLVIESALGAGARAAARFGTTGTIVASGIDPPPPGRDASIVDIAVQYSGYLLLPQRLQITEASYPSFAALESGGTSATGPGSASQVVEYTFTYTQPYLTPIAPAITGQQQLIHSVQVVVQNEPFPSN
jgi:Flp pilus assembly protein TadG